jgi:hypothetical protein
MKNTRKKKLSRETKHKQKIFPIHDVGAFGDNGIMCIIAKTKGGGEREWWGQFNFDDALGWQPQHCLFLSCMFREIQ